MTRGSSDEKGFIRYNTCMRISNALIPIYIYIYYSLFKELVRVPLCGAFVRRDFGVCSAFVRGMCGAMCKEGARNPHYGMQVHKVL